MIILGIETSCDETAAAILKKDQTGIHILSNIVASSADLQAKYGGIIPEQAAREQLKSIIPVIETAIHDSRLTINDIDAIAVTYGPGLIGSLLVGTETAKVLSLLWKKPLIPVNHLLGHFYANWITAGESEERSRRVAATNEMSEDARREAELAGPAMPPKFPCLALLVSGGHTDLVLFEGHGKYKYLGGTRDDAAGECFDKCARLLGLPYPGGPQISKLAEKGDPTKFKLPVPMQDSHDLDFSYSGLKTAVANIVKENFSVILAKAGIQLKNSSSKMDPRLRGDDKKGETVADLAASIEATIVKSLIDKVVKALQIYKVEHIMIAGGVAANQKLQTDLRMKIHELGLKINLHVPAPILCTDNGAMIAAAAFFQKPISDPLELQVNPNLSLA